MPSSGEFFFSPTVAEVVDDAFEDCGIDPQSLTARHLRAARRAINREFVDWINRGHHEWLIEKVEHTVSPGEMEFELPEGFLDVTRVTLQREGRETEMYPISRSDYRLLYDKTLRGRPDRYFVARLRDVTVLRYWQAGQNDSDKIIAEGVRRAQDAGAASDQPDIPYRYQDAIACGLAERLALKFAPDRLSILTQKADRSLELARQASSESVDAVMRVSLGGNQRTRS